MVGRGSQEAVPSKYPPLLRRQYLRLRLTIDSRSDHKESPGRESLR